MHTGKTINSALAHLKPPQTPKDVVAGDTDLAALIKKLHTAVAVSSSSKAGQVRSGLITGLDTGPTMTVFHSEHSLVAGR